MSESFNRREVLQGSLALAGVPLCCRTPAASPESISYQGSTLVLDLAKAPALGEPGTACAVVDAARKLNLIVARVEQRRYVALDRSCTHGGAPCAYSHKRRTVRCTSLNHAEYDLQGTLLHGRTHGNLGTYPVRLTGTHLEIALERA